MKRSSYSSLPLAIAAWLVLSSALAAQDSSTQLARVLRGRAPADIEELKALQERIRDLTDDILASTVAIQVGRANGSGVIVSKDGYVLTAAHVAGTPKQSALIWLSDGSVKRGITLGLNQELDAGMIKITEPGDWPFAPLGQSSQLKAGQWCLATGHPGGFDGSRRSPVLRWGRVLKTERSAILTDCTLVGGDSGGPLFDMHGRVVGIHSRIGKNLTINVHVPVDPYRSSWDRLVRGEVWGMLDPSQQGWLGVTSDDTSNDAKILEVVSGSPARMAGLRPGDVIVQVNEAQIGSFGDLQSEIRQHRPDDEVRLVVRRGEDEVPMVLRLGKRPTRRGNR